ncbi:anaerobic sulfatase maturase [Anaerosinus massiliensis]|uniref:anaerobic sulfatase maturase n=1 Tax=Massilibacillus massiliensis TaxID=1806837 RepID=UPI000DA6094D|nr:anaerobic sulfatase maturase [Massilibacillus massiliensis]
MPSLVLMVKPASGDCNLSCTYCFYHALAQKRKISSYGSMDESCMEILVKKAFGYAEEACTFAFQGGEPTLIGLAFYQQFVLLVEKYNVRKIKVYYALQTNGTLLNEAWVQFLARHDFMVGLSLDGSIELHNAYRMDQAGKGSYHQVMQALGLLQAYQVNYNVLAVITRAMARKGRKVYQFFKNKHIQYLQFIPYIETGDGRAAEIAPRANEFALFLMELFDVWYSDLKKGEAISIQYFDNLLGIVAGLGPEVCGMSGSCACNLVIEADGSVYPCDFYAKDAWLLGNIHDIDIEDFIHTRQAQRFIESSLDIHDLCKNCGWYSVCRGGCRRFRETAVEGKLALHTLCRGYKKFFPYVLPRLKMLAKNFPAIK